MNAIGKAMITVAYTAISRAVKNAELWDWIEALVKKADDITDDSGKPLDGITKKLHLLEVVQDVREGVLTHDWTPTVRSALQFTATWLISLAIDVIVARMRVSSGG